MCRTTSRATAKFPAIVYIHGGPASQFVDSFNPLIQYVVNQGYLVIAPNFRGSTGYGKEFMNANYRDEGGGDLNDVSMPPSGSQERLRRSQKAGLDGRQLRRLSHHDGGHQVSRTCGARAWPSCLM